MRDDVACFARHTAFSDPGRFAVSVREVSPEIGTVSGAVRNVIEHYRASDHHLPAESEDDIDARWVSVALAIDAERHGRPLADERKPSTRLQGCCRDHALMSVAILREHGVPARTRVGFAGYFTDGWHHDHVVVEVWDGDRWRLFDPELEAPVADVPRPDDMRWDQPGGRGFVSAAAVWLAHRRDGLDVSRHGVGPDVAVHHGVGFCFDEVMIEVAHLCGDELLLWDVWGRMHEPGDEVSEVDARWLDGVAELVVAAGSGGEREWGRLQEAYASDEGLRPGDSVTQFSPRGRPPVTVDLRRGPRHSYVSGT